MVAPVKNGNAHRGHGGGGRPYGLMLLLALGAAILGVMVLHKLREGRLFSLLVKEKDQELLSLHLLLQNQREFNKEAQKKLEETKMNLYSVTAQKSDVEGRLLEVKSLVSSLKDEQKILESQLEEKRNEINLLRQQQMIPHEEIRFTDTTNQKQGEIEDQNGHLEEPASVWSVSSDDPSNPPLNFTDDAVKLKPSGEMKLPEGSTNDADRSVQGAYSNNNETDSSNEQDIRMVKSSKQQRKLRRRKWRDVIRQARERNVVEASRKKRHTGDEVAVMRKEDLSNVAGNVTHSSLEDNAETKEEEEEEEEEGSKVIDKGSDHVEENEKTKFSKDDDDEQKTN